MVNNVGTTTKKLSTQLGGTTPFVESAGVNLIAGQLGVGCLLFDTDGTVGAISAYTSETNFTVTTYALSIDINAILSLEY